MIVAQALLLCSLGPGEALTAEREKTDVITQQNGDRATGRILYAQFGLLHLDSAHSGTLSIEWPSINGISSVYPFRVERFGGLHYQGTISTTSDGKHLIVGSGSSAVSIPMLEVSSLVPFEEEFWKRIDGSVWLGYDFTQSNHISDGNFGFKAFYSGVETEATLSGSAVITKDSSGRSNDQDEITSTVFFLGSNRNFWGTLGNLQRDPSLGINARVAAGPLLGRRLLQRVDSQLSAVAGVAYAAEWDSDGGSAQSSLDAFIGASWRVYKFVYPKVRLDSSLLVYPSLTDAPRVRGSLNITLTYKLTDRFSIKLSESGMYDSRPPTPDAQTSDFNLSLSAEYDFGPVII
jgi:hypothetical protein